MDNLLIVVCSAYNMSLNEFLSKKITRDMSLRRFYFWLYAHEQKGVTYTAISKKFNRTFRGLLKSIATLRGLLQFDKNIRAEYADFVKKMDAALL